MEIHPDCPEAADAEHFTAWAYKKGCRCPQARRANTLYLTRHRRRVAKYGKMKMPIWPSQRKIRALSCIGHAPSQLALAVGRSHHAFERIARGALGYVLIDTHLGVEQAWEMHREIYGPNDRSIYHAQRHGWAPPWAWPGESINDWLAKPTTLEFPAPDARRRAGVTRRVRALGAIGYSSQDIADAVNETCGTSYDRSTIISMATSSTRPIGQQAWEHIDIGYRLLVARGPGSNALVLGRAKANSWPSPAQWDESTIDDPSAEPYALYVEDRGRSAEADPLLVEVMVRDVLNSLQEIDFDPAELRKRPDYAWVRGRYPNATPADRKEAAVQLLSKGGTVTLASKIFGPSPDTIRKMWALRFGSAQPGHTGGTGR